MSAPETPQRSSGRIHLIAIIAVTLLVMILGVLVVVAPDRMGVPNFDPTPVAPIASPSASP